MNPSPPRGAALRAALVEEAAALIEEAGYAAFNTRALAARLSVTQPAIYRHFPSREALLEEVVIEGLRAHDTYALACAGTDEPYGRLLRLGVAYVAHAAERPGVFRLAFGRRGALASVVPRLEGVGAAQGLALRALAQIVPPDDPAYGPSYRAWWGLAHGLSFLTIERVFSLVDTDAARVSAAEAAIAAHLDGLRARWGEPHPPSDLPLEALFARLIPPPTAPRGVRAQED